jgi:hypothetical protein
VPTPKTEKISKIENSRLKSNTKELPTIKEAEAEIYQHHLRFTHSQNSSRMLDKDCAVNKLIRQLFLYDYSQLMARYLIIQHAIFVPTNCITPETRYCRPFVPSPFLVTTRVFSVILQLCQFSCHQSTQERLTVQ